MEAYDQHGIGHSLDQNNELSNIGYLEDIWQSPGHFSRHLGK